MKRCQEIFPNEVFWKNTVAEALLTEVEARDIEYPERKTLVIFTTQQLVNSLWIYYLNDLWEN